MYHLLDVVCSSPARFIDGWLWYGTAQFLAEGMQELDVGIENGKMLVKDVEELVW